MKVLFVISTLRNGGAERVASVLSSHFASYYSTSLVRFENTAPFYELNPKLNLISLQTPKNALLKPLYKMLKIRKISKDYDIIISFMDSTNILVLLANLFTNKKVFISEHSSYDFVGAKWRILRRIFYPLSAGLSVLSKSDFEHYSFVKNKAVIYNPVSFSVSNDDFIKQNLIIFVGRLEYIKGCDIFLNALKIANLKDFKVEILGDGSERKALENLAKELGLNVSFCGNVQDIENYYKRAKIVVLSSRSEGLGNALIESIFYKCLRVATPTSGAKELINDEIDGFISKDFSANSLANALQTAINAPESIAQNAYKNKDIFSVQSVYNKWLDLIKSATK